MGVLDERVGEGCGVSGGWVEGGSGNRRLFECMACFLNRAIYKQNGTDRT